MLELPPTIRLARWDELPENPDVFELFEKTETANLVEGFNVQENTSLNLPFKFYAEVNVDNSRLWELFSVLTNSLPENVSLVFNLYDEKARFSPVLSRRYLLSELGKYKKELTGDCYFEFGFVFETDETFEEVFVHESKYLSVWGNDETTFRNTMRNFGLSEIPNLSFIDEFPKVVEPLSIFDKSALETDKLADLFEKIFRIDAAN